MSNETEFFKGSDNGGGRLERCLPDVSLDTPNKCPIVSSESFPSHVDFDGVSDLRTWALVSAHISARGLRVQPVACNSTKSTSEGDRPALANASTIHSFCALQEGA